MAHHTSREHYSKLVERLNRYPQGAPPSEILYKILKMLFSEKEARCAKKIAYIWNLVHKE